MAFVNGSMTQGDITRSNFLKYESSEIATSGPTETKDNSEDKVPIQPDSSNEPQPVHHHHRHYRLFRSCADDDDNQEDDDDEDNRRLIRLESSSSTASFLAHMNKPSPTEIRQWMADTQETVGKVVTNWQQDIIDKSLNITELLSNLVQFVQELEEGLSTSSSSPPPTFIFTSKCKSNHGTFESVVNVYLHLILIALRQAVLSREQETKDKLGDKEEDHRKRKFKRIREQKLLVDILGQFSMVAEDSLRFLKTHKKILKPVGDKVLEIRNNLYYFLCHVVEEPKGQILPLINHVRLDEVRREEHKFWLRRSWEEYKDLEEQRLENFLDVEVGAKECWLVVVKEDGGDEQEGEGEEDNLTSVDMTVNERLELILLLLRQLDVSIGSSNKTCVSSQNEFMEVQASLMLKFQHLARNLNLERRENKLYPENCSDFLKESLCHLEVKFHQVEKILEEIPQHLRRVIGVADQCSRQIIQDFGLEEKLELEESSSWTSPIEDISEEFFKKRLKDFIPGCFPYLWSIIAKIFFGGKFGGGNKKLKEFWEEVRTEMEDFQKEIKLKEMENGYGVNIRIPLRIEDVGGTGHKHGGKDDSHPALAKYAHTQLRRRNTVTSMIPNPSEYQTVSIAPTEPSTPSIHHQEFLILSSEPPGNSPELQTKHEIEEEQQVIIKEFKYVCEDYKKLDKRLTVQFLEGERPLPHNNNKKSIQVGEGPTGAGGVGTSKNCKADGGGGGASSPEDNFNYAYCNKVKVERATAHKTDKLKKKLDSYLAVQKHSFLYR